MGVDGGGKTKRHQDGTTSGTSWFQGTVGRKGRIGGGKEGSLAEVEIQPRGEPALKRGVKRRKGEPLYLTACQNRVIPRGGGKTECRNLSRDSEKKRRGKIIGGGAAGYYRGEIGGKEVDHFDLRFSSRVSWGGSSRCFSSCNERIEKRGGRIRSITIPHGRKKW